MAYRVKRAKKIIEDLELEDDNGKIIVVTCNLDADTAAVEFRKKYNEIIKAEQGIKKLQQSGLTEAFDKFQAQENFKNISEADIKQVEEGYIALSDAVLGLYTLIFGEDGCKTIIEFFKDKYFEMAQQISPFILDVVNPAMSKAQEENRKMLAKQYKGKQKIKFGIK